MDWIEPEPLSTGPGLDTEHRIQLDLIDALLASVREERGSEEIEEVLDRFEEFSRAHFLSEELLMRLHSYADYEDHVGDHTLMTDLASSLRKDLQLGRPSDLSTRVLALRQKFVQHIHDRDRVLESFLETARAAEGRGS